MSIIDGQLTRQYMPEYSENLVPVASMYNGTNTWVTATSGTTTVTAENSDDRRFEGEKALKVVIEDSVSAAANEVTVSTATDTITAEYSGLYPFSMRLWDTSTVVQQSGVVIAVDFYKNGSGTPFHTIEMSTDSANPGLGFRVKEWNCFTENVPISATNVVTWKYRFLAGTSLLSNPVFYIDGVKLELRDRELGLCSMYSKSKYL